MSKIKPNPALFRDAKVGRVSYKPLEHKDGRPFNDVEYFELLGRKAIELDKANKSNLPTNYGVYDRDTINVAKQVAQGIDEGYSQEELQQFLNTCIDYTK